MLVVAVEEEDGGKVQKLKKNKKKKKIAKMSENRLFTFALSAADETQVSKKDEFALKTRSFLY